jgi:hypothetical protein
VESELLIGKILAAAGWQVVYYNQRRGYGFDLWAKKGDQALVLEVKSFVGVASSVILTSLEHQAAEYHGENFLLVIVENATSDEPEIHVLQNPLASIDFVERDTAEFSAARSEWEGATIGGFPDDAD